MVGVDVEEFYDWIIKRDLDAYEQATKNAEQSCQVKDQNPSTLLD